MASLSPTIFFMIVLDLDLFLEKTPFNFELIFQLFNFIIGCFDHTRFSFRFLFGGNEFNRALFDKLFNFPFILNSLGYIFYGQQDQLGLLRATIYPPGVSAA